MTKNTPDDEPEKVADLARKPRPVTPELRAQVAKLHAEGIGRNAIARQVKTSAATVSKIARELGLLFDRAGVELAVRARLLDLAAARTELAASFFLRSQELLEQMEAPTVIGNFGGRDNVWNETLLDEPPIEGKRSLMSAAATAARAGSELTRVDVATMGTAAARGMIGGMIDALGVAVIALDEAGALPDPTVIPGQADE